VASTLAIALKCDLTQPWLLTDRCVNVVLRWQIITALDVVTETAIVALTGYLVWNLQMGLGRKMVVITAFGCRVPVIACSVVRVTYLNGSLRSPDPTLKGVNAALCTQVLFHYSLMAATIPCLKPFVISFDTGWGQGREAKGSTYLHHSGVGHSASKLNALNALNAMTSGSKEFPSHHVSNAVHQSKDRKDDAANSIDSHESQRMIIRETRGWAVEHESFEMKHYGSRGKGGKS